MTTRCLRIRSPVVQLYRYASSETPSAVPKPGGGRKYAQRVVNERKVFQPRASVGSGTKFSAEPLKATYEPSPIFGAVIPTSKEALKKSTPEINKSSLKEKSLPPKEEERKKPLTEDEKNVID